MKRVAVITLLAVFVTTNYAFATSPIEELAQKIEQERYEEITQEEIEEVFSTIITSLDWETLQYEANLECIVMLIYYTVTFQLAVSYSFLPLLIYSLAGYFVWLMECVLRPYL